MLTVGSVINGGFRPVRERPISVAIWGLVYTAITVIFTLLVLLPATRSQMSALQSGSMPGASYLGAMLIFYLILIVLSLVLFAAPLRTMLRPDEAGMAGMRFGMDELRLLGLFAILSIAGLVAMMVLMIAGGIVGGLLVALTGGAQSVAMLVVVFVAYLLAILAIVYFQVRFSLTAALTILRRKIIIGESWRLTRGHFWRLFGAYLMIGLMLIAGYLLVAMVTMGPYFSELMHNGFSPAGMRAAGQSQLQRQLGGVSVMMVIGWIGNGVLVALSFALWGGAAASATDQLIGVTTEDYAETFA